MRFKSRTRALAAATLSATVALAGLTTVATPAGAAPAETDRVAGTDRYGTAAEAATRAYPGGASTVVVTTGERIPDALSANPIAGENDAPILLVQQNAIPAVTQAAMTELDPENVIIVGGTAAVSNAVQQAIAAQGITVTREAGADRFETAAEVARAVGDAPAIDADGAGSQTAQPTVALANGITGLADAVAASPMLHQEEIPLLLTGDGELNEDAAAAIDELNATQVLVLGGTAAISESVEDELEQMGLNVERLAGATRFETAAAIADFEVDFLGFDAARTFIASGFSLVDALAGGPLASVENGPIVLVSETDVPAGTATWIEERAAEIDEIVAIGGTAVINDDVLAEAAELADETGTPPPAGQTATTRPELVSASVVQTTAQGTTVRYIFDEALTGAAVDASRFHVYRFGYTGPAPANNNGAGSDDNVGDFAVVESGNTRSVLVTFTGITTASGAGQLSVATVDEAAVRGLQGATDTNVVGDAALNPGGTTALSSGITVAPDLVSVGNFRANPADPTQTLVDFTFDEAAYRTALAGAFHLISTNGELDNSSGIVIAGDGTTVLTLAFENDATGTSTVTLAPASVARGTVDPGAVGDAIGGTGNLNVLQAADVSNSGNSETPDLVSAVIVRNQPNPTPGQPNIDAILFTFDEPVLEPQAFADCDPGAPVTPGFCGFQAYLSDGTVLPGLVAQRSTANDTQVAVIFGQAGSLDLAVGAIVTDGAVREGSGTQQRPNQQDEVGAANPGSGPTTVSGRTSAPDLTAVSVAERRDAFGTLVGARVTFTFDEDVFLQDATRLGVVLADGVQYLCAAAPAAPTLAPRVGNTEETDNTVICDAFTGATTTQVLNAVVGFADDGAVANQAANTGPGTQQAAATGTDRNPEGAELISGTQGTPRS